MLELDELKANYERLIVNALAMTTPAKDWIATAHIAVIPGIRIGDNVLETPVAMWRGSSFSIAKIGMKLLQEHGNLIDPLRYNFFGLTLKVIHCDLCDEIYYVMLDGYSSHIERNARIPVEQRPPPPPAISTPNVITLEQTYLNWQQEQARRGRS